MSPRFLQAADQGEKLYVLPIDKLEKINCGNVKSVSKIMKMKFSQVKSGFETKEARCLWVERFMFFNSKESLFYNHSARSAKAIAQIPLYCPQTLAGKSDSGTEVFLSCSNKGVISALVRYHTKQWEEVKASVDKTLGAPRKLKREEHKSRVLSLYSLYSPKNNFIALLHSDIFGQDKSARRGILHRQDLYFLRFRFYKNYVLNRR
jgi:hypothetical protein